MNKKYLNRKNIISFIIGAIITKLITANWDEIKRIFVVL